MADNYKMGRRGFLKQAAGVVGATTQIGWPDLQGAITERHSIPKDSPDVAYPRSLSGRQLKMIAFPLGGVCLLYTSRCV